MTPRTIARLLWVIPGILLFLTVNQVDVAVDVRRTLEEGTPAVAEITGFESSGRVDITYDYIDVRVPLPDGQVLVREKLSLPHSFAPLIAGHDRLDVRVLPGADQEIVITEVENQFVGRAQWRMALINAAMCFVGFLLVTWAVFAWNRYLARRGDPAER